MSSEKKWIYLSYIGATVLCAWVLNKIFLIAMGYLRWPNPPVLGVLPRTSVAAVVIMSVAAYFYFRQPKVDTFSTEVVAEIQKVTWPQRKNTYLSTVVVIITVMVMAVILGLYDWICASLIGVVLGI